MDIPTITEPREEPPEWAVPPEAKRWESARPENNATEKQLNYIDALRNERMMTDEQDSWLGRHLQEGMTRARASEIIERLLTLAAKPGGSGPFSGADVALVEVPAGRYAVENEQGELRFYKKWVAADGKRHYIYVQHGPDESKLPLPAQIAIAKKILAAGVRAAAIRYGMEIGACSNCGLRLTNRISRELGIGPVCGGRMFGDDFKAEVKAKRKEIKARGEDPNETLED